MKHGMYKTRTYQNWQMMWQRCTNPNNPGYKNYGGRGINVCKRWGEFENFLADMGLRPDGMEIERVNNDGDYEPSNCTWASHKQNNNNKRNNYRLTLNGRTQTISQWAEETGIKLYTIRSRIERGWPADRALCKPATLKWDPDSKADKISAMLARRRLQRIRFRGENLTVSEWAARLGVKPFTMRNRLKTMAKSRALAATGRLNTRSAGQFKLDTGDIVEIKNLLKSGTRQSVIARRFGITQSMVSKINSGVR